MVSKRARANLGFARLLPHLRSACLVGRERSGSGCSRKFIVARWRLCLACWRFCLVSLCVQRTRQLVIGTHHLTAAAGQTLLDRAAGRRISILARVEACWSAVVVVAARAAGRIRCARLMRVGRVATASNELQCPLKQMVSTVLAARVVCVCVCEGERAQVAKERQEQSESSFGTRQAIG